MKQLTLQFGNLTLAFTGLFTIIAIFTSCGTSKPDLVSAQEHIESVISFCFSDTTMVHRNSRVLDELGNTLQYPSDSLGLSHGSPLLSKNEINHIFTQARDTSEVRLKAGQYPHKLIPADTINHLLAKSERFGLEYFWDEVRSRYGRGGYIIIHKPVFSSDYEFAIVAVSHHCGSLCGQGSTYILRKEGDEWVREGVLSYWIS